MRMRSLNATYYCHYVITAYSLRGLHVESLFLERRREEIIVSRKRKGRVRDSIQGEEKR